MNILFQDLRFTIHAADIVLLAVKSSSVQSECVERFVDFRLNQPYTGTGYTWLNHYQMSKMGAQRAKTTV